MKEQPDDSVDLVFCSPPYEAARTYGIDFKLKGQAWVDWSVTRYLECVRICRGLVCWVVEGQTRQFRYSAAPILLMADLHRAGVKLRKPPAFARVGIAGSGGPDWLRNDYEFIVCSSKGKLPWSDNTAMGHPPKYAPGGAMSHRLTDGTKRNQWGGPSDGLTDDATHTRNKNGVRQNRGRPSHKAKPMRLGRGNEKGSVAYRTPSQNQRTNGECGNGSYLPPVLANPGNVIKCLVGGGVMGSKLCHENEAPFPEKLAEFFVLSFCPPAGTVLDIFSGSGTTAAVAVKHGRNAIGIDIRESQVDLSRRRLREVQTEILV
jgi:hypothetical protein